jgi:hypothetical protein
VDAISNVDEKELDGKGIGDEGESRDGYKMGGEMQRSKINRIEQN